METTFPRAEGVGRPIVSSDLDGTMIYGDGSLYEQVLQQVHLVTVLREMGGSFMLSSDTSNEGLRNHEGRMQMHGLVDAYACEGGAYLRGALGEANFLTDFADRAALHRRARAEITEGLSAMGWDVMLTHPAVTFEVIRGCQWPARKRVLLLDNTRQVSLTATAIEVVDGIARTHREINGFAVTLIHAVWLAAIGEPPFMEHGEGWIDMPAVGASKCAPLTHLRTTTGRPVYHIGDGSNDVAACDAEGVVVIAVGADCSLARKGKPHFVTEASGPAGWMQAMQLITEAHQRS